jgi:hypothetical protein
MLINFIREYLWLISFVIFLFVNLIRTQQIYNSKYILFYGVISFSLAFIVSVFFRDTNTSFYSNFIFCLLTFYYFCFLFLLKCFYKQMNIFFVKKKLVKEKYLGKDFTYVSWDGDLPSSEDTWEEDISSPPSGLDKILSFLLIILPLVVFIFLKPSSE